MFGAFDYYLKYKVSIRREMFDEIKEPQIISYIRCFKSVITERIYVRIHFFAKGTLPDYFVISKINIGHPSTFLKGNHSLQTIYSIIYNSGFSSVSL